MDLPTLGEQLATFKGKCRQIFLTWSIWVVVKLNHFTQVGGMKAPPTYRLAKYPTLGMGTGTFLGPHLNLASRNSAAYSTKEILFRWQTKVATCSLRLDE